MAYVAISQDLRNRVKNRIHTMRNNEIKQTLPELEKNYNIDAHQIYNYGCWGKEHMHLITVIPKDWLCEEKSGTVHVVGDADLNGDGNFERVKAAINFGTMVGAYRRPSTDYWNKSSAEVDINDLMHMASTTPGRDECIARYNDAVESAKMMRRWAKVETEIMAFLDRVKSLNEAVKLFPGIKLYLDKDDVARMERKVDKRPREELVADIDLGQLTAAAVVAQLNGGV
jgi:hypothetical protein